MNKKDNKDRWLITRDRHIPAVYPLLSLFDWNFNEYFKLKDSGHVINVWNNGQYLAIWEKQKILVEFAENALNNINF